MASKQYDDTEIADINMTPFVDIVLVILIIFMVTATFVTQGKIPLNLPQASSQDVRRDDVKPTVISLTAEGQFYYDDENATLEQIDAKLASIAVSSPKIVIRSDAKTPFEFVVKLMDICKKYNINSFAIQTTQQQ